jgi:hypothetical protein
VSNTCTAKEPIPPGRNKLPSQRYSEKKTEK